MSGTWQGMWIGHETGSFATGWLLCYTETCKLRGMEQEGGDKATSRREAGARSRLEWKAASVRALRRHLGLTQGRMAEELGTRQQTVSEWETGLYRPRGTSVRLLTIVAERAGFQYGKAKPRPEGDRAERSRDSPS